MNTGWHRHGLLVAIAIHLALMLLLLAKLLPMTFESLTSNAAKPPSHFQDMVAYQLRGDVLVPPGRIIFLGDSLTQGLPVSAITDIGLNYGIGSDDTQGLLLRIPRYASLNHARAIVLTIGINDLKTVSVDSFKHRYIDVLSALPKHVQIHCNALLPLDIRARKDWQGRSNELIQQVNLQIKQQCHDRGHRFSSAWENLADDSGNLGATLHDGDGLHLNASGNALWIRQLRRELADAGLPTVEGF